MNIFYISPSEIPSRSANSIHVLSQTEAFSRLNEDVYLFCNRTIKDEELFHESVRENYGIDSQKINVISYHSSFNRAMNLRIAILSIFYMFTHPSPDMIISRNLYASFFLAVIFRKRIFFETHQLEFGFKRFLQMLIVRSKKTTTIVISKELLRFLKKHIWTDEFDHMILHDAARDDLEPINETRRRELLDEVNPEQNWKTICSYFGAIHFGRGVEVIHAMAKLRPEVLFLIYGGTKKECNKINQDLEINNLVHYPHIPYHHALERMQIADILLMPYQRKLGVGIDGKGANTSDWMSPMKMFDYLASGVPIISSDLKPLREVLEHKRNSMLSDPIDVNAWLLSLDALMADREFSNGIAKNAYLDYKANYTWTLRSRSIINKHGKMKK